MSRSQELIAPTDSSIKAFVITAVFFLDIGILFGGLNALRLADIFPVPEIHQTHWTSTLFGGMTVIMLGQILYFIHLQVDLPEWIHKGAYLVLFLIILGALSSYTSVWLPENPFGEYFVPLIKIASLIYLFLAFYPLLSSENRKKLFEDPAYIMVYNALIWMGIAQLVFLGFRGIISLSFRVAYIYGFFSLTLFGSLSIVLPRLLDTDARPKGTIIRDSVMINISAILLTINEFYSLENPLLGLLGSVFWGLVGFLFILYIFDLIYKTGLSTPLIGLSVALIMFGFFVFDTFMKSVFPHWVNQSHAHFMFLGTLVITIISVGIQLISKEITRIEIRTKTQQVLLGLSVTFVGIILLGFTFQLFAISGYAGISLFVTLVISEILIILKVI